jgi:hypothetical protein
VHSYPFAQYMPSKSFIQAKQVGRQFEALIRPELVSIGLEVIDSDNQRYEIKKGYDCLVRVKNPDGTYKRNDNGVVVQNRLEIKYDKMSEQTGNVCIDLDSISKSTASIWIFGLPYNATIDTYAVLLSDLAPYALSWPNRLPAGEFRAPAAIIPKDTFTSLPFVKKFKTIDLESATKN